MDETRALWAGFTGLFVYVTLFMLAGPSLILLQKYIIGEDGLSYEYPIFLVTITTVARLIIMLVAVHTGIIELGAHREMTFTEWVHGLLPVGLLESVSLATGMTAYLHLTVSFMQMLKAFQPVIVHSLIIGFKFEPFSWQVLGCIAIVSGGSVMSAVGEVNFDKWGCSLMLVSEFAEEPWREAFKYLMLHYFFRSQNYTLWEGLYFSTPACAMSLLVLSIILQREVTKQENLTNVGEHWWAFLAVVVLAFVTAISGFGIVKEVGADANKVLTVFRNAILIYPAMQLYHETVMPIQMFGYALTMVGTLAFSVIKVTDEAVERSRSVIGTGALMGRAEEGGKIGTEKEPLLKTAEKVV